MSFSLLNLAIERERDVVFARQRSRQVAQLLGFEAQDQTRISTALSEVARNAYRYASGGRIEFRLEGKTAPQLLLIRVRDQGRGIDNLQQVLDGEYRSETGMGLGIIGAKRLMDGFDIRTSPAGTLVELKKLLPRSAPVLGSGDVLRLIDALAAVPPQDAYEEIQRQNQELLAALDELRRRQDDLVRLNQELEDTNRGVVALYAELDERADHLRRADELKTRFLSNMSHEFRTPLNSILALSGLLLGRADGDLTSEQEKQIGYIRRAADELSELVNDLLDLAKVEAGKVDVRPTEFDVAGLFGALRGMLRPLLTSTSVELVFEEPEGIPLLHTDESKVSQILRNFISNALKFTERGEVRVWSSLSSDGREVTFGVTDTGIGIATEDLERIFQEFTQVDSRLQRKVRGTGLGLPLTRKFAGLLGGRVAVDSEIGRGSTFTLTSPVTLAETAPSESIEVPAPKPVPGRPVLLVEDTPEDVLVCEKHLEGTEFRPIAVSGVRQAREVLASLRPEAILLDILLKGADTWSFLADLKANTATARIPVLVVTTVDDERKARTLGADAFASKPLSRDWLLTELKRLTAGVHRPALEGATVLIIDDDPLSRYVMRSSLSRHDCELIEAHSGAEGLALARRRQPRAVVLDLVMPEMGGEQVLEQLKADPATREIPVLIHTSTRLGESDIQRLERCGAFAVVGKGTADGERVSARLDEALASSSSLETARGGAR